MIGMIITGHGQFAEGILSAAELIAGKQEAMTAVNFPAGDTTENLRSKLEAAMKEMACDSYLFLTDLAGGTPFNQSVLLSEQSAVNCRVMSGINLPAAIEAVFARGAGDLQELTQSMLASEQARMRLYEAANRKRTTQSAGGI